MYQKNSYEHVSEAENVEQISITKLTKDLKSAAAKLSTDEARFLVDYYYDLQDDRIRAKGRVRASSKSGEPHEVITWLSDNTGYLEKQIQKALTAYAESSPVGRWCMSICGIAGTITAGLLAHIDLEPWRCLKIKEAMEAANAAGMKKKCNKFEPCTPQCRSIIVETSGQIERFAGLDPSIKWGKGKVRPFNAKLKVLLWKAGESFVKVSNNDKDFYGKIYKQAKEYLTEQNEAGKFKDDAARYLTEKKYGKNTEAYKAYTEGKLPLAQIHGRAKRKAVKLFVSHFHEIAYQYHFGRKPAAPYSIAILSHSHYIAPPNNPF